MADQLVALVGGRAAVFQRTLADRADQQFEQTRFHDSGGGVRAGRQQREQFALEKVLVDELRRIARNPETAQKDRRAIIRQVATWERSYPNSPEHYKQQRETYLGLLFASVGDRDEKVSSDAQKADSGGKVRGMPNLGLNDTQIDQIIAYLLERN